MPGSVSDTGPAPSSHGPVSALSTLRHELTSSDVCDVSWTRGAHGGTHLTKGILEKKL